MKYFFGISNILEAISSLSHSIVSLYFFALITEETFLISPCYSLELCIQLDVSFIFSFAFASLLFSAIVRPPQTTILPFCISFSWRWSWSLPPVQCHEPLSIVLQALCLSDLIPWIYLSLPLYNCKGFDLGHTSMIQWFSLFFNLSLNFAIRSSWSETQSALSLVFADCKELLCLWLQGIYMINLIFAECIELLHLWLQRI